MYTSMLDASDGCGLDFGSLRVCITCGPAMPGDTRCRYEERFGCIVLEGYALSDPAPAARFNQPGKPRQTAAAIVEGWLCSGDTGFVDEDGYFYIVDRAGTPSPGVG